MIIGYARFSLDDCKMTEQQAALETAGCRRIYYERQQRSGTRPELDRMLVQLSNEDVVVVTHLNRLARSTSELLELLERLTNAGAGVRSITESWADTTPPNGQLVLRIAKGVVEFERAREEQRISAGREAAHARGVKFGRPSKLTVDELLLAKRLLDEGMSCRDAAKRLNCHNATLYRSLKRSAQS